MRDFWVNSVQGLFWARRGRRGALGPRLLRDSRLSHLGCGGGRGRRGVLSHVGTEQRALQKEKRRHLTGVEASLAPASLDKGTWLRQPSLKPHRPLSHTLAVRLRRVAGLEARKLESTSRLVVLVNLGEPHLEEMKCGENKTFLEHSCDIVVRFLFFVFFFFFSKTRAVYLLHHRR